jgi:hypothetical protein
MHVSGIEIVDGGETCELRASIECRTEWVWGHEPFRLWYRFPEACRPFLSARNGDPFVAALLAPAMVLGEPLQIDAPVSAKLLASIPLIQTIYRSWDRNLHAVAVEAPVREDALPVAAGGPRAGLFFSMGVDSCYSLARSLEPAPDPRDTVTHLITVEGFDVYLWESQRFPPLLEAARRVAGALGKSVVPVTTNLRELGDRTADWVRLHHGAAMASVALALGTFFDCVWISASQTYARLVPKGAHPLLDPLWTNGHVEFRHVGLEASRLEKIREIARRPALVENLRVCITDELTSDYNCGRCEKCLRTMLGLYAAGALDRCRTLPQQINPDLVRGLSVSNSVARESLREIRAMLSDSTPADRALRQALAECLARSEALSAE